jgi:hypothetical protein
MENTGHTGHHSREISQACGDAGQGIAVEANVRYCKIFFLFDSTGFPVFPGGVYEIFYEIQKHQ